MRSPSSHLVFLLYNYVRHVRHAGGARVIKFRIGVLDSWVFGAHWIAGYFVVFLLYTASNH
jgi:hypothetical protein